MQRGLLPSLSDTPALSLALDAVVGKRLVSYPNRVLPVRRSRVSYRRLDGTNTNGSGKAGWAETLDRFGHGRFFRGPQFSVVTIVYA